MSRGTVIIAEAGVNHNGSLDLALELVDKARECGADAIKFQTFRADRLVTEDVRKADYQESATGRDESQYEMIRRLELTEEDFLAIERRCRQVGIEFLSTPFDPDSLDFLVRRCGVSTVKISSGEITNGPLLLAAARTGRKIILSTGMSTIGEVERALSVLAYGYLDENEPPSLEAFDRAYRSPAGQSALRRNVTLLHCTTEYPAPFEEVNLRVMDTLRTAFGLDTGYSDHTAGIAVPIAAAARGAAVIEKHFTLDRTLPGPDHRSSLEPDEFRAMVEAIRAVELSLGSPVKMPTASEQRNQPVVRKTIVAARPIREGETFTADNLAVKRAGTGLSPMAYWDLLGRKADRPYRKDQAIQGAAE